MSRHQCPGETCAVCAYRITEIEHPYPDDGLSDARAEMEMRSHE